MEGTLGLEPAGKGTKGNRAHEKEVVRPCVQTAPRASAGPKPQTSPSPAYRST